MEPIHYYLQLEPDLDKFVFSGLTQIQIQSDKPANKTILNQKDLRIISCKIKTDEEYSLCEFEQDNEKEELLVRFPQPVQGKFELKIQFKGEINDKLLGLYRSSYSVEGQEEKKYIATTQFEERNARWAFPCYDAPRYKTTFDIEFVIDENLTGISNCDVSEEIDLGNGKKLVKFDRTPRMCTYLLYFGIGEFDKIEDTTGTPIVRVYAAPGQAKKGQFALEMSKKTIKILERLTGVPYPLTKMDNIAVCDFAFGAMENWGAVAYRDHLLFVDETTSKPAKTRNVIVVAHENAHMWFGNLVSPADWQYVWLNESFASYFERVVTNELFPEWNIWDEFILESSLYALNRDMLINTPPIELPGGKQIDINTSTAPIIYDKGASIIRVLSDYLGEEKFKRGIIGYMDKFKHDISTTEQFWNTFEEATGEPIREFADSWVHQRGYPFVRAQRNNNILTLEQNRFTILPHESDTIWFLPITYSLFFQDGTSRTEKIVMKEKSAQISLPENVIAYKLNTNQMGFYRVFYRDDNLMNLGKLILEKKLSHLDIYGIQNDLFYFVLKGEFSVDDYLGYLKKFYAKEEKYLPLIDISGNLSRLYFYIDSKRSIIADLGRTIFEPYLTKIGLEPREDDSLQTSTIRSVLFSHLNQYNSNLVKDFIKKKYEDLRNGIRIHADILNSMYRGIAANHKDSKQLFLTKMKDKNTGRQEMGYILGALGNFHDEQILREMLGWTLDQEEGKDNVPMNLRYVAMIYAAINPVSKNWLWDWYKTNIEQIKKRLTPNDLGRTIGRMVPRMGIGKEEDVGAILEKIQDEMPSREDDINMALEYLKVYSLAVFRN